MVAKQTTQNRPLQAKTGRRFAVSPRRRQSAESHKALLRADFEEGLYGFSPRLRGLHRALGGTA